MKQKTCYICEFCEATYFDQAECEECEAKHFGLTRKEYLDWRTLTKEASNAGKKLGYFNNKSTRNIFDEAVKRLVRFEQNHGLSKVTRKPTDFFF